MPEEEKAVEDPAAEVIPPKEPDEGEVETPKHDDKEEVDEKEDVPDKSGEYEDTDTPDIPVRSREQHIIARQRKQIKKLRSQDEQDEEYVTYENEDGSSNDDSDDDLTPEMQAAFDRRIAKEVGPLKEALFSKVDEDELGALFEEEPDAKNYEKSIRAYMNHDAWKAIPPSAIYHHLNYKNSQAVGASRRAAADLEAGQMRGAGSGSRPSKGGKKVTASDITNMSDEEFDEYVIEQKKSSRT